MQLYPITQQHTTLFATAKAMEGQNFPTDDSIWEMAHKTCFIPPPKRWIFGATTISFGSAQFNFDKAAVYELALLDIHAQYWEVTGPEYIRRYHRGLQYHAELHFQNNNSLRVQHTPAFLHPWLVRTIFRMRHNENGRVKMRLILNDMSEAERSKLETPDLQADGILSCSLFHTCSD